MQCPLSGARALSCLCFSFRALGPAGADNPAGSSPVPRLLRRASRPKIGRTGRQHQEAARISRAAGGDTSAMSAAAGSSAETVPQPRAADNCQSARMTAPVKFRGFLGGEILRTVHRPETPGAPPEPSTAGPVGRGDAVKRVRFPACGETNDVELASTRSDNFIP